MEIWKDIKDYQGYQVSNLGRVRTFNKTSFTEKHGQRHWKNRILKQKCTKHNMMRVDLWNDKGHKTLSVHRLVAVAFLGNPPQDNMTVNHKDGNRRNNCVDNLEWLTLADNIRHGFNTGLYTTQKKTTLIDEAGKEHHFVSRADACRYLGRSNSYIIHCNKNNKPIKDQNEKIYYMR